MAKASPILTTFDGGELSPLLGGRVDLAKYANGCSVLENFLPTVQGPLVRRGGTRFVAPTKDSTGRSWLIRFQVSETVAYMLEFGGGYIRFFANRGQLLSGATPVEVATPYTWEDLTASDGTCRIRVAQSADTMYIFHVAHKPRKLLRTSATMFSLAEVDFTSGPFKNVNSNQSVTVLAGGETGAVTLSSSASIFNTENIGDLFYVESFDRSAVKPWAVYQKVAVGDRRRVDYRVYECTAVGTGTDPVTGTLTPTHTEGRAWDGDGVDLVDDQRGPIGVEWLYLHAGYGIVQISTVTNSQLAAGTVIQRIPSDVTVTATYKWAHALFSSIEGWPEHGAFWRERLVLARTRNIAMSVVGDFENFSSKIDGEVTADAAIVQTLNARLINRIVWVVESDDLILGTNGDEWIIGPVQSNEPVGPSNIRAARRTAYGSRPIQPVEVGGRILFIQSSGRKVRDYQYDYGSDNYISADTTKLNPGISHAGLIDMTYQQEPDSVIWAARSDGQIVGMTYDQEMGRSDVYSWHRHPLINGWVEAVEAMPAPDGSGDDLWMVIRRTVDGQVRRYVEYLNRPLADDQAQAEAFYVDCGLTYRGAPASSISGLGHLEGQTVDVLIDGATHPQRTVSGGKIELQSAASIVHVGLPAPCAMATMSVEAGAADGTAQGKTKRITNVVARLYRSLGGKLGNARDKLESLNYRRPSQPMGSPPPLFTGDTPPVPWPSGYETSSVIWAVNDQPLPFTILALMPIVHTQDDR